MHFLLTQRAPPTPPTCTYTHLPLFLSQTIYTGGAGMKRNHPFAGMEEKDLATSAERFTAARHMPARMNDFHPLAPFNSVTHGETRGKGNTYTHMVDI